MIKTPDDMQIALVGYLTIELRIICARATLLDDDYLARYSVVEGLLLYYGLVGGGSIVVVLLVASRRGCEK